MKTILTYSLLFLVQLQVTAYTFRVEGYVMDQHNQAFVQHEVISMSNFPGGNKKTLTDNNGFYQLDFQIDGAQVAEIFIYTHHWCESKLVFQHGLLESSALTMQFNMQLCRDDSPAPECAANFLPYLESNGHSISFFNTSMADSIIAYHWDFGDGDYADTENPFHHYGGFDRFIVQLEIETLSGCSSQVSYLVVLNQSPDFTLNLELTSIGLPNGNVFLYVPFSAPGNFSIYKVPISGGTAQVWDIPVNQTYLWALPEIESEAPTYPVYLPVYYGDALAWQDAEYLDFQDLPTNLSLLSYPDPYYGNGSIRGRILRNDSTLPSFNHLYTMNDESPGPSDNQVYSVKQEHLPAVVLLENDQQDVIAFQCPDINGYFRFEHLPIGNYRMRTEIFHKPSNPVQVNLSDEEPESLLYEFVVGNSDVTISVPDMDDELFRLYPNPAGSQVYLQLASPGAYHVFIYAMNGTLLWNQEIQSGNADAISLNSLSSGFYMLKIVQGESIFQKKLIKF